MSCIQNECETNATLCKKHEKLNTEKHRTYRGALRWKEKVLKGEPLDDQEDYAYLITVPEGNKKECTEVLDDIDQTRREIHMNHGPDSSDHICLLSG